jgi:hypothetical protein
MTPTRHPDLMAGGACPYGATGRQDGRREVALFDRRPNRLRQNVLLPLIAVGVLGAANGPPLYDYATDWVHERKINSTGYKRDHGFWQVVELPKGQRINAIHAAVLPTGRLLLIAGSGNKREQFEAGTFRTLVFDPDSGDTTEVPTPTDLFCAGHAFLPDGKLLVAGGTLRYEVLQTDVTHAGGTMTVKNESPDHGRAFRKGTVFVAPDGRRYLAGDDFEVAPATKTVTPAPKARPGQPQRPDAVTVSPSEVKVWVDAEKPGAGHVTDQRAQYEIEGLPAQDAPNIYGLSEKMTMDKQDYQGRKETYEFNPVTERYERVADMHEKRWYPTLTALPDGKVLSVSGLDGGGQVVDGSQNEIYDPATKTWTLRPDLDRYFPTYPSLFQTGVPGRLFYSGSNAGYGPEDRGRDPGFWNLTDNSFTQVPGLRDPDLMETSTSAWVGPIQNQTVMVVGGGGIGESARSSKRIDLIKLDDGQPRFTPGPDLPEGTRYAHLVQLPDDTTLITNGSRDYRGRGASDNHTARLYHPATNSLSVVADPRVGRNYHSSALLLPDGRVLTIGSDPLFRDKKNTIAGEFDQRIEIYTPPYLFRGARPVIEDAPPTASPGTSFTATVTGTATSARLIRPGSATHMLNTDQRSVALALATTDGGVSLTVPNEPALVPPGPYLLFVTDQAGVPSIGRWITVA